MMINYNYDYHHKIVMMIKIYILFLFNMIYNIRYKIQSIEYRTEFITRTYETYL
jgi:hypothetical protein